MFSNDHHQPGEPSHVERQPTDCRRPVIIGLYGLPGSGKTYWLDKLKQELSDGNFICYEGSHVIAALTPGGLDAFQQLSEDAKVEYRHRAIAKIEGECRDSGKSAIVAGHYMFWPEEDEHGRSVCVQGDLETYTHILYLNISPAAIAEYRSNDVKRYRPTASIAHLRKWQETEKSQLSRLCRSNHILFTTVSPSRISASMLCSLIQEFRDHTEDGNLKLAKERVDKLVAIGPERLETILVFDADKTLAAQDSGVIFWEQVCEKSTEKDRISLLKTLFGGPLQYSYTAFRQATLLYEEAVDDDEFDRCCSEVASMVSMHSEIVQFLHFVRDYSHVRAVVITCGLGAIWERVLRMEGLSNTVKVIGGGRLSDGLVITPAVKAALVSHLRTTHQLYVFAFGDGPVDLEMLQAADQAIVVTGDEENRSKTMENKLADVLGIDGFHPRQVLLPPSTKPRLDTSRLPLVRLMSRDFMDMALGRHQDLNIIHATERSAAKLLMTSMRDASVSGPALRDIHHRVGWYLATEFCTRIIGIEPYPIKHVQGHETDGYRLLHEKQTLIVPLMRGGELMAFSVNEALPLAIFLHAKLPSDIQRQNLANIVTVILVDSVVNSGKSILDFVQHIRSLHGTIRIVIVAGVIHSQTISAGRIAQTLGRIRNLSFVALRLSENKFTGRGTTDTGNRLFNTTHMP
ncbi:hypothetical protein N7457_006453 [Penicillium paradoxum]|uniref:uncharacterized protein n=1 Tax=Penicillium paradoxum TaxID=176176 RepID=UPI0025499D5B|nr:uncharacterized protein N7457_006453 [Penicillium paradoxum]KAJ5781293.1 hypothetical protein N7457_006453 [Penicillium paradoxum]